MSSIRFRINIAGDVRGLAKICTTSCGIYFAPLHHSTICLANVQMKSIIQYWMLAVY